MKKAALSGVSVLVVGDEQRLLNVPRRSLPKKAREGHWLKVELEGDQVTSVEIDRKPPGPGNG